MFRFQLMTAAATGLLVGSAVIAEPVLTNHGGDEYIAGSGINHSFNSARDVFAAGNAVTVKGSVGSDAHVVGFDVDVESATGADLYAAGGAVTIRGTVGEDLTATGFSVRTAEGAMTAGNARIFGGTLTIDGAVEGALTAMGNEVILNSRIGGDAWLVGDRIHFGPNAIVLGQLRYTSDTPIEIPARVAAENRVQFTQMNKLDMMSDFHNGWSRPEMPILPSFISVLSGFLITLSLMVVLGAIFLSFAPKLVEKTRGPIADSPGRTFLVGIIGLSMLFGLVPITALTIVGIPLVPVILLAVILAWMLGYLLGVYTVAIKALQTFGSKTDPSVLAQLVVLAIAIVAITVLNFIPFVGWVINYTIVLLGLGGMATVLFNWILGNQGLASDVDMKPIKK